MRTVFLSSTARDLTAYREAAYHAIERLDGFHCVRMEDFGARAAQADDFCRAKIAECDVAVFIAGLCYGSRPEASEESYTVREYQAAKAAEKPCLVFLSEEGAFYAGYYREPDEQWSRQQAFRAELNQEHIRDAFTTPEELAGKVATAISNWAQIHPEPRQTAGKHFKAEVHGAGAIAQEGGVAAGAGGIAIKGNVYGDINVGSPAPEQTPEPTLRKAYLNRVMERCGYLSLAGIDPAAAERRDKDAQFNLSTVYTALLTRSPLSRQIFLPSFMSPRASYGKEKQRSALEQLDLHRRLVLQGDPGSGKSTFVNFVALCLAGEALGNERANLARLTAPLPDEEGDDEKAPQPWSHGPLLPLPVVLRDFAAAGLPKRGEAKAKHLWDFIASELTAATLADYVPYLKKELRERGGLLLLDGLDEVPEAEQRREQIKQAIEDFLDTHGQCRVLVTSRTYAYQNQGWRLQGFAETILAPFSDGQIRRFVARWYELTAGLGRLSAQDAAGRAELLKRAIFSRPTLHELAERPLLLTLMASLHAWRGGDLPEKREPLYADAVDLLLNRWEQRLIKRDLQGQPLLIQPSLAEYLKVDKSKVRHVLEGLAFEAHQAQPELTGTADISEDALAGRLLRLSGNPDASIQRLVEYLWDRAGLLYPRGVGVYTFPHRSFQEYLAACHLTDDDYPDKMAEFARRDPDRWREAALLAGAKAARGSAASLWNLVEALCFREPDEPGVAPADDWGAQIAAQALVETADLAKPISPANQRKLERIRTWLVRLLRRERLPATERALAGDNLAVLSDPRFNPNLWHLPDEPMLGFVEVPAGPFKMGSDKARDKATFDEEVPQHDLNLPRYYMARWPVTVAQFAAFVAASGYAPADRNCLKGPANHPVVWVTWHDAVAYCRWLGERLRALAQERRDSSHSSGEAESSFWQDLARGALGVGLPSEAEWEKAARGADGRIYPWGDKPDPDRANYGDTGLNNNSAVGCFPRGVSPCGCEEMSGNVWEWTRSLWGEDWGKPRFRYPYDPTDGREDLDAPDKVLRVLRGGAFDVAARGARCAYRFHLGPDFRHFLSGFRVVVSPFFSGR